MNEIAVLQKIKKDLNMENKNLQDAVDGGDAWEFVKKSITDKIDRIYSVKLKTQKNNLEISRQSL